MYIHPLLESMIQASSPIAHIHETPALSAANRGERVQRSPVQEVEALHKIGELDLPQRLRTHVEELCKIPRYTLNFAGMQEAVEYIKNAWGEIGLEDKVKEQCFEAKIPGTDTMMPCKNIIVSLGAEDGERIVVGAHYDTDGIANDDESASSGYDARVSNIPLRTNPGADDNASAVAGLLETGRALKEIEQDLRKNNIRVDLVAYANEECPYYHSPYMGSMVHAKSLKEQGAKVKGMLCYEMIGYFDDKKGSQGYLEKAFEGRGMTMPWYLKPFNWLLKSLYKDTGDYIGVIGNWDSRRLATEVKKGIASNGDIETKSLSIPQKVLPLIELSDHWSYWQHGYPAVMITDTSFLRNPNYHKASDTPDSLNYSKMSEVVKGVIGYIKDQV